MDLDANLFQLSMVVGHHLILQLGQLELDCACPTPLLRHQPEAKHIHLTVYMHAPVFLIVVLPAELFH